MMQKSYIAFKYFNFFLIFVDTNSKRMFIKPGFCLVSPFLALLQ